MQFGALELNVPPEAVNALRVMKHQLGSSLLAVYLHGSAVAQGLRKHSDVDFFAVVDKPLTASVRAALTADLMAVSGHYPFDAKGRRPLEVMIVRLADLEGLSYPARAELVYGEWLRGALESGAVLEAEANPEITLLLAQAREEAVPLIGPNITDLVPEIPFEAVRKAIGDLLPTLMQSLEGDERNVLLTLARMWVTLTSGKFVSKDVAADWVMPRVSEQAAKTLALARNAYLGNGEDDLHLWRTEVSRAAEEMREHILSVPLYPA